MLPCSWRRWHVYSAIVLTTAWEGPKQESDLSTDPESKHRKESWSQLLLLQQEGWRGAAAAWSCSPLGWLPGLHHPFPFPACPHFLRPQGSTGHQCLQSQNIQETSGLQPFPHYVLRSLYLPQREKHSQGCPKPIPFARRPFEIAVSQKNGGGLVPLPAWSVSGRRSPREGTEAVGVGVGGQRRDVVFLFLAVLLYWCREDASGECKALRVGKGLVWVGDRQYITEK